MATTQFTIEASKYYLNSTSKTLFPTNIELKEGDLLKVTSLAAFQKVGVSYKYDKNTNNPNFEFPVGSLIGTINDGKTFFPVAGNVEIMCLDSLVANAVSKLSLVFWGVDATTTIGSVTVTVEVEQQRALNEVKATTDANNALFQDRFQFAVHANANSVASTDKIPEPLLETGIQLKPGDLLIVDAPPKDLWGLTGGFFVNANAIKLEDGSRYPYLADYKSHPYRLGSLVATIDDGKTFFPVGTHLQMTILNAGMLSFACWDINSGDNYGFVKACVKVIRNGKVLTYLDIKTIQGNGNGNGNGSSSGSSTSNGTGSNYSDLDCSKNLPKLSAKLKSDLSAAP
jgi:hypothetical protein